MSEPVRKEQPARRQSPMRKQQTMLTFSDLMTRPEEERWELIDGVAYDMSPAPSQYHQEISLELTLQFGVFLRGNPCRLLYAPFDVLLPKPWENDMTTSTVVEPDLIVVCDLKKLDGRKCVGAPTLVVEITSPTTADNDLNKKREIYERAGVPEYWVLLPDERKLFVFTRKITGWYGAPTVYTADEQAPVEVLPGLMVDLARVFSRD